MNDNTIINSMTNISDEYILEAASISKPVNNIKRRTILLIAAAALICIGLVSCGVYKMLTTSEVETFVSVSDAYIENIPDYIIHEPVREGIPRNTNQFWGSENKESRLREIAEEYGISYAQGASYGCKKLNNYFIETGSLFNENEAFVFLFTNVDYLETETHIYIYLYNEKKDKIKYDYQCLSEPGAYTAVITAEEGWNIFGVAAYVFEGDTGSSGSGFIDISDKTDKYGEFIKEFPESSSKQISDLHSAYKDKH